MCPLSCCRLHDFRHIHMHLQSLHIILLITFLTILEFQTALSDHMIRNTDLHFQQYDDKCVSYSLLQIVKFNAIVVSQETIQILAQV